MRGLTLWKFLSHNFDLMQVSILQFWISYLHFRFFFFFKLRRSYLFFIQMRKRASIWHLHLTKLMKVILYGLYFGLFEDSNKHTHENNGNNVMIDDNYNNYKR